MYDYFNNRNKNYIGSFSAPVEPENKPKFEVKAEPKKAFPYKVKIIPAMLNCRSMPNSDSPVNHVIIDQGIYNIVREKDGWGMLDTGAGWINLKFTEKLDN